jgi:hypothetical protein
VKPATSGKLAIISISLVLNGRLAISAWLAGFASLAFCKAKDSVFARLAIFAGLADFSSLADFAGLKAFFWFVESA